MPPANPPRRPSPSAPPPPLRWTPAPPERNAARNAALRERALVAATRATERRFAAALGGGLTPRFGAVALEPLDPTPTYDRIEVALERHGRGDGRLRARVRFLRGSRLVARAVLDGSLEFAELRGATAPGGEGAA